MKNKKLIIKNKEGIGYKKFNPEVKIASTF